MDYQFENYSIKSEPDIDGECSSNNEGSTKLPKNIWTAENTVKLINAWKKDCRELWDVKSHFYRDKLTRTVKQEYLAEMFGTTVEEINRKLHNLRSQFNNELRKLKRRRAEGGAEESPAMGGSGWEYFDALSFLMPESMAHFQLDPLEQIGSVNIALAEFQANEEDKFGVVAKQQQAAAAAATAAATAAAAAAAAAAASTSSTIAVFNPSERRSNFPRVAASGPPVLPPHPPWETQPFPRINPGTNVDECQVFGDFVASELRTLRSEESKKRLKRIIQKAILEIGEEEDEAMIV